MMANREQRPRVRGRSRQVGTRRLVGVALVSLVAVVASAVLPGPALAEDPPEEPPAEAPTSLELVAPTVANGIVRDPDAEESATLETEREQDLQIVIRRTRDFRDVVDGMVRRVYDMRREFIDSSYKSKIQAEEELAHKARKDAIAYFEEFLLKYPNHPPYTPDAMFRLAELYYDDSYYQYLEAQAAYGEAMDRGEADDMELPNKEFDRTIDMFRSLVARYPEYRNIDGAYYVLGYCLNETGKEREARMAWLSFVCANKHNYDLEALEREKAAAGRGEDLRPAATLDTGLEEEVVDVGFKDPFVGCTPLNDSSRFYFESWWLIGNYHFDYDTSRFGVETAIAAYKKLVEDPSHRFYNRGLYKLAWSYFKANRYVEAIHTFSRVVDYSDAHAETAGTGVRPEAIQYLGACFFDEDWDMDSMPDGVSGIERVQDPSLMPQDRPWTREVYAYLGDIYFENEKNEEAIQLWKLFLERWPLDVEAPFIQEKVAIAYNKMHRFDAEIAERERLDDYGPDSEWWKANEDHPAKQNEVAQMARDALLGAAYFHHDNAQKLRAHGLTAQNVELLERAREEYNLAAEAYRKFIENNPDTPDAYDINFYLADALFWSGQYKEAKIEYTKVRDSNLDDKHRADAAKSVLLCLEEIVKQAEADGSLVLRQEPPDLEGDPLAPPELPLPPIVLELMNERDELIRSAPDHPDAAAYKYQSAQNYYRYGHWDEARARYEDLYNIYCTTDPVGIISWQTLINMSVAVDNIDEKERLALMQKERQCGVEGAEGVDEGIPLDSLLGDVAMHRAMEKFSECTETKDAEVCTAAGEALTGAVTQAPDHPNADAALHNAALAYENAQRFETAMKLYGRIVQEYPESQWVDKCLFKQAYAAANFFEYEKALDNYRLLADEKRFADSEYRNDAVQNSALILTNLQRYVQAVPYWKRYADQSDDPEKAIEANFKAADMYYRAKKWRAAIDAYNQFINRYDRKKEAGPFVVKASYKSGLTSAKLKKIRDERKAWGRTIDLYHRLVKEPGSMSAEYAAESHFLTIEVDMRDFEKFSIKGSMKVIERKIKEGAERVKDFETRYREIQDYRRPEWSLAAEFRIGYAYEVYAKAMLNIPPPPLDKETQKLLKQLPKEDRELVMLEYEDKFRATMEEYVAGAEEKAQAEYRVAVDLARKGNISNEWTLLALERMNAYDPENYPRQHDGSVEMYTDSTGVPQWEQEVE